MLPSWAQTPVENPEKTYIYGHNLSKHEPKLQTIRLEPEKLNQELAMIGEDQHHDSTIATKPKIYHSS